MKKLIYCAAALATALFAGSCQRELLDPAAEGNTVTYTVNMPEVATKAGESNLLVNNLVYAVYRVIDSDTSEEEALANLSEKCEFVYQYEQDVTGTRNIVSLELINNQKYVVAFWAQKDDKWFTHTNNYNNVTGATEYQFAVEGIGLTEYAPNVLEYDAFSGVDFIDVNGSASKSIELTRPFAQLNIATNLPNTFTAEVAKTTVTVTGLAHSYNVVTKEGTIETNEDGTNKSREFVATKPLKAADDTYAGFGGYDRYISANYVFVAGNQTTATVSYAIETAAHGTVTNTIDYVPLARNYKTNIVGNLLTSKVDYTVDILNDWSTPDNTIELWDGESIEAPALVTDQATGKEVYAIKDGSNLAWLAAAVNGTLPAEEETQVKSGTTSTADSFAGKTFVLTKDVNLDGNEWTPVGTSANPFKGTFDGNGYTIHNLVVNGEGKSNQGLFGYTKEGEIKNVTVENAKVSGRLNVAVVAGQPYTSKYTNITVKGHVEVNGMAYIGGVGGKNAYADWTNITVNVDENSYVKAHSIENGTTYRTYVGGVVGFNGEGGHKFSRITSNINVQGSTCDVGGLFGIAHYNNKFENCVCTGNVEIYAAEDADEAEQIGGIAGVWHNENGTNVTFTNCSFKGNVTTNVKRGTVWYNNLVGKPYGDGTGTLAIDGLEFTKDGVNFEIINNALAAGTGYKFPFDLTGKATASNAYGATGLNQLNGGTLDGNSATLKVTGAGGTWGSAINTTGGTIKDITVAQGFRGIFINHNSNHSEKVILENVTVNGPTYAINCDQGMYQGLEATNCTINGWTSYAETIGEVTFTGCSFGKGAGYKFARPYAPTTFVNCDFCEGFEIDARAKVVFENCRVNGVTVTKKNFKDLVTGNPSNVSWLKPTFADNTWEDIIGACQENAVPESWNVGNKKSMTIGGKDYQIAIIGKNHDGYTDGSGKAPLTFQVAEVYCNAPMNATQTNTTGWSGSVMRTKTMLEILNAMPSEVKDKIKEVNKETLNGTRDGLETTSDKLFLLSEIEVNGSVYFSNNFEEGSRYAYYANGGSVIMSATWWLRGPGKNNALGYTQINQSGYMANGSAENPCGVVFGFCF